MHDPTKPAIIHFRSGPRSQPTRQAHPYISCACQNLAPIDCVWTYRQVPEEHPSFCFIHKRLDGPKAHNKRPYRRHELCARRKGDTHCPKLEHPLLPSEERLPWNLSSLRRTERALHKKHTATRKTESALTAQVFYGNKMEHGSTLTGDISSQGITYSPIS